VSKEHALNTMTAIQRRQQLAEQIRSTILPGWQFMMLQLRRRRSLRSIGREIGRSCGYVSGCTLGYKTISPESYERLFQLWQKECG
jgi:hypothetical protein